MLVENCLYAFLNDIFRESQKIVLQIDLLIYHGHVAGYFDEVALILCLCDCIWKGID